MENFESQVTKMGRKRMINVPAQQKGYKPGTKVIVSPLMKQGGGAMGVKEK